MGPRRWTEDLMDIDVAEEDDKVSSFFCLLKNCY
jgi:hypothetical protein